MTGQRQPIELVLAKGNKHFKTQLLTTTQKWKSGMFLPY